ncbi:MAG: FecR domain-containing protein [Prolixibacteraceae bacterium]|jgi:ferric-dicitrate binding protein FerR (iron transport regulator)
MESEINQVYSLIAKSLSNQLDEKQAKELEDWKLANDENLKEYNDFVAIWIKSGSMKMPTLVNEQNAFSNILKETGIHSSRKRWINLAVQVAAVLILSIIFSGVYPFLRNDRNNSLTFNQPIYQEVKAAFGTQAKVELADGTTVYLNSGSKLRFPETFSNQELRKVSLDGEGYFAVTKNPKQSFVVEVNNLNIKVLGTTFNVDAYHENEDIKVALIEGSILLEGKTEDGSEELLNLSPNQVATLNRTDHSLSKTGVTNMSKYTDWINGKIVFVNDPIETVVIKLGKWYNVDITIADKKLSNYSFTATFIDESLEQILDVLSLTSSMTYKIESSVKQADNSMSKRKVILKSKNLN